jgi:hypothetical protein
MSSRVTTEPPTHAGEIVVNMPEHGLLNQHNQDEEPDAHLGTSLLSQPPSYVTLIPVDTPQVHRIRFGMRFISNFACLLISTFVKTQPTMPSLLSKCL